MGRIIRHCVVVVVLVGLMEHASADFANLEPPLPQPNDIGQSVNGCANAILAHDNNNDGKVDRMEFLDYVNNVADLLCLPPRPSLDLELNTLFVTIACLCTEREGFAPDCCIGSKAAFYTDGAADQLPVRTEDQDNYLRQSCLLTQAVLGDEQCNVSPATLSPGAIGGIAVVPPVAPVAEEPPNPLLWFLLMFTFLFCCLWICCTCRRDKENEEEWHTVVVEETIVKPPDEVQDRSIPPMVPPPDVEAPPEPFDAGDEMSEAGAQPRPATPPPPPPPPAPPTPTPTPPPTPPPPPPPPAPPTPPPPTPPPPEEPDDESEGKAKDPGSDDEDSEAGRRFRGEGLLPPPKEGEGIRLRPVVIIPPEPAEYEYPERELLEPKPDKDEDSVQEFEPYIPDGGVYDPQRPVKPPVEFNPSWQREVKPEPVYVDPRKQRKQMGLGDGEVWDALDDWEEEEEKKGKIDKMDWVIQSCLTVFANAEDTGELAKEDASTYEDAESSLDSKASR